MSRELHQGCVYACDLTNGRGSEEQGVRPCIIMPTTTNCMIGDTVLVVPITKNINHIGLWDSHVGILNEQHDLVTAMVDHARDVDKTYVQKYLYTLDDVQFHKVQEAFLKWIGVLCVE